MRFKICGFDPWVRKIPWRRAWQPTPVFLPGESHGQRNWVGYGQWGHKESDMTEVTSQAHGQIWVNTVKYPHWKACLISHEFMEIWCLGGGLVRPHQRNCCSIASPLESVCVQERMLTVWRWQQSLTEDAWWKQRSSRRQMEDAGWQVIGYFLHMWEAFL